MWVRNPLLAVTITESPFMAILSAGMAALALVQWASAAELADIPLPSPRMVGGIPLMQVLKERQSSRGFSPKALPD